MNSECFDSAAEEWKADGDGMLGSFADVLLGPSTASLHGS